tara:strand:+ start:2990 stop:3424 length:435 start_codon:yes stop_codon:yes gene_type:complete
MDTRRLIMSNKQENILYAFSKFKQLQKIELSVFSENLAGLKTVIKNVNDVNQDTEMFMEEAESLAAEYGEKVKAIREMKKYITNWFKGSRKFLAKVDKQVKELGINPNDIPDYKEYKGLFEELEKDEDRVFQNIKRAEAIKKKF